MANSNSNNITIELGDLIEEYAEETEKFNRTWIVVNIGSKDESTPILFDEEDNYKRVDLFCIEESQYYYGFRIDDLIRWMQDPQRSFRKVKL